MTPELTTDLATLARLVELRGRDVIDIGCGAGGLARELASRGARVVGVETSEEQLGPALAEGDGAGVRYLVGRAQALPLADASVDVAVFMRSLHHVPAADMAAALSEARRVLRPGGVAYVAEPLPEGDFFDLLRLVEDEREVRQAAQRALRRADVSGLAHVRTVDYAIAVCLRGLDGLRARVVGADPGRAPAFDAQRADLRRAFERLGSAGERPGERCFVQPMRADVLRHAAVAEVG